MKREGGGRVLLIEDDVALLQLMSVAFEAAGYQVQRASDGAEGLKLFHGRPADLVVTDMIMPVREGVETIVALKKASAAVKIIAISGGFRVGPQDYLSLAGHVGADEVMAKPFHVSDLVAAGARLLATAPTTAMDRPRDALEAAYDMADRLDDAIVLARLLVAAEEREAAEAARLRSRRSAMAAPAARRRPRRA